MHDHYRDMALHSITDRLDLKGWLDDLTDTNQFTMADQLLRVMQDRPICDDKLFMLAWYLKHCDSQRP